MEDEIKRNIEGYYIHGFKSIGYVQLYPSPPPSYITTSQTRAPRKTVNRPAGNQSYVIALALAALVLLAAFALPYFTSPPAPK